MYTAVPDNYKVKTAKQGKEAEFTKYGFLSMSVKTNHWTGWSSSCSMHKSNSSTHTALQKLQMKLNIFPEKAMQ